MLVVILAGCGFADVFISAENPDIVGFYRQV
jgi:hypothetical protein